MQLILSLLILLLSALLVYLILKMPPRPAAPVMQRVERTPPETEALLGALPTLCPETSAPQEEAPCSRQMSSTELARLVRLGTGIPRDMPILYRVPEEALGEEAAALLAKKHSPEEEKAKLREAESPLEFRESGREAWVHAPAVNLRETADLSSAVLGEAHAGEKLFEERTNGSWSQVRLEDGRKVWIASQLLSYNPVKVQAETPKETEPPVPEEQFVPFQATLYSNYSGVNVRRGPGTDSEILGRLFYGDSCQVRGYTGGWFQIEGRDGALAYVNGEFLQEEPIQLTEYVPHEEVPYIAVPIYEDASKLAGGQQLANLALGYIGTPYVFGGADPSGFDCSGLVQYLCTKLGQSVGRTTYEQVYNGMEVPFTYRDYSNLVPGDLLLFPEGSDVNHVGIYIGGGQMVHASAPGIGVVVDDLNGEYFASRLAYVRRIFY